MSHFQLNEWITEEICIKYNTISCLIFCIYILILIIMTTVIIYRTVKITSTKLLMKKWYPFMLKISPTELLVNIEGERTHIKHRISMKKQHGKITVG